MIARLATRKSRLWAITLALVLNVGGGPMAWAQLASGGHCHAAPVPARQTRAAADCPEHHAAQSASESKPAHPLPCCDGGSCACAAPPAPLAGPWIAPADARHDTSNTAPISRRVSSDPLDDTLRPPIH